MLGSVAVCLFAQPNVRDVRNAAGGLNPGLPGYGIAPGSLISIEGTTSGSPQTATFPLTTNLNGVSVRISVNGQDVDALMAGITPTRVLAVVPSFTPTGSGTLAVTDGSGTTALAMTIVNRNFGLFAQRAAASSVGAAYAINLSSGANTPNGLTTPAMPGQQILILGSGAGATTQDETNAVNAESLGGVFQLFIGGLAASIVSTGRSGLGVDGLGLPVGLAGVDSIVAVVPTGVSGCRVSVVAITETALVSNFSTIAVSSDGSTCSDPGYLSANDINVLPASGTYNVGVISMSRFTLSLSQLPLGTIAINTDNATASFQKIDVNGYRTSGVGNFTSVGSCIVTFSSADASNLDSAVASTLLDAGSAITLMGPNVSVAIKQTAIGDYAGVSASGSTSPFFPSQGMPFVEAGPFAAGNGAGGADVQGFTAKLTNPTPFTWSNQAQIASVDRTQGVNVTWTGGASDATVIIAGSSSGAGNLSGNFTCSAPASAGAFQVPSAVTLSLPASTGTSTAPGMGAGSLSVLASTSTRFTAPGLDQGVFTSAGGPIKTLNYQ